MYVYVCIHNFHLNHLDILAVKTVAIQEAWKEWNPTDNILSPATIESRNGGGLVKLSDSLTFHGTSDAKQKVLKGTKKN